MTLPLDGRRMHSRIRGRASLERRTRALLIAVHRYARCRATTPDDHRWCARMVDALTAALAAPDEDHVIEAGERW